MWDNCHRSSPEFCRVYILRSCCSRTLGILKSFERVTWFIMDVFRGTKVVVLRHIALITDCFYRQEIRYHLFIKTLGFGNSGRGRFAAHFQRKFKVFDLKVFRTPRISQARRVQARFCTCIQILSRLHQFSFHCIHRKSRNETL